MLEAPGLDALAQRLAALLPADLAQARSDFTANARELLQAALARLDLVTREEFDAQRAVLQRTRALVEQLEARVVELEAANPRG